MSSQRIYRNQLPPEKIIQELENNKGTQFDPEITDIFLKLLREDRIHVKENLDFLTGLPSRNKGEQAIAQLMKHHSGCLVCRLGGDEFLLFMPDADQNSITDVITAIFKKFNTRKEQDPELHAASISAGLYMCNIGDSFDECYTKADKALYFVKQNGKSDFSFHEK